jgi:beta-glucosidase
VPAANPVPPAGLDGIAANLLQPPYAVDGDATTRYSSGADMLPGDYFAFDMCRKVSIDGVNLVTAPATSADVADVPLGYAIQVSADGTTWTQVAASATAPAAQAMITFPATTVRYVLIIQTGTSTTRWWSIHEVSPICP